MPTTEPEYGIGLHRDDGTEALFTGRLMLDCWGYLIAFGLPQSDHGDQPAKNVWSTALKQDAERVARLLQDNCFPGRLTTSVVEVRRGA